MFKLPKKLKIDEVLVVEVEDGSYFFYIDVPVISKNIEKLFEDYLKDEKIIDIYITNDIISQSWGKENLFSQLNKNKQKN